MKKAIMGVLPVGAAGGALLSLAGLVTPVIGMPLGCVYGLVFCLIVGRRASTPGGGLLWGLAFALLFWLFGSATIGPLFMSAFARVDDYVRHGARLFPGPGWLHPIFWRSTRDRSWNRKSPTYTRSAWASKIQLVPGRRGRRTGGHPGRMGFWSVDGESKSFSSDRGPNSS